MGECLRKCHTVEDIRDLHSEDLTEDCFIIETLNTKGSGILFCGTDACSSQVLHPLYDISTQQIHLISKPGRRLFVRCKEFMWPQEKK